MLEEIREGCARVAARARLVHLAEEALPTLARDLAAANPGGAYELRPVLLYNPDPRRSAG